MGTHRILIRNDGEWGEFFYHEYDPVTSPDGHVRYSATWCCNSSFGVFGYHWYSMGEPFSKFAASISDDYLINKISKTEVCDEKALANIRKNIRSLRRERRITAEQARDAMETVKLIADDSSGRGLLDRIYHELPISLDWEEISCMDYPMSAQTFVRKLWPAFVAAVGINEREESCRSGT